MTFFADKIFYVVWIPNVVDMIFYGVFQLFVLTRICVAQKKKAIVSGDDGGLI